MKRIAYVFLILIAAACATKKTGGPKPLYEVLTTQSNGGAGIRFNEILTEEKEIRMLQNDENLRKKINPEDLSNANFVILNMGEKNTDGYQLKVKKVEETADKVIITVEEIAPANAEKPEADIYYFPYTIIKVNSKKTVEIK